jgi:hypothetical protein
MRAWMRLILDAAGHTAELVRVPDDALPADLRLTRWVPQHLLVSSRKAGDLLGWRPADTATSVARSVRWHLDHPPTDADPDFAPDDAALARSA